MPEAADSERRRRRAGWQPDARRLSWFMRSGLLL